MKASAFEYRRAESLAQAGAWLAAHEGARIIAGGQSLMAMMNMRLAAPSMLIDIVGVPDLRTVAASDGVLRIGALVRHADLLRDPLVARHAPLIVRAAAHIAHPAIRNRGTIGGNLAHADPASEQPACMVALGATLIAASPSGERAIAAEGFFRGVFETALARDEILTRIEVPAATTHRRFAFHELARRSGDYALAGLAAGARADGERLRDLRLAFFGVGETPVLARRAGALLEAGDLSGAQAALAQDLAPQEDVHASAALRLQLSRVLLARCAADLCGAQAGCQS